MTDARNDRARVVAPTEVTQGTEAGDPIVSGAGPELPAAAETKIPASAAPRRAWAVGPNSSEVDEPSE
jgi:hypothetical protein